MFHVEQKIFLNFNNNLCNIPLFCIMMRLRNKILTLAFSMSYIAVASLSLHAQTTSKHLKAKPKHSGATIGFQSGRELLFNSSPLIHSKQSKVHYGISNALVLRKPLGTHFKAEAGINYNVIQGANSFSDKTNNNLSTQKAYQLGLPVTINYFCLPEHCRVRPYFGAGVQYNVNLQGSNAISPFSTETYPTESQMPGTKYISILFTQGVTFQVNTRIEINQSFHFIPDNANKVIGINLGFGYKLP